MLGMATAKKPMTKAGLTAHLADNVGLTKKQAGEFLEQLSQIAYKEAKCGFTFPGIGKLELKRRKARMGRNPQTGEAIKIPAKTVLKFRFAKACKDAVLPAKK
jgi:DNA-binding protein HU-beta